MTAPEERNPRHSVRQVALLCAGVGLNGLGCSDPVNDLPRALDARAFKNCTTEHVRELESYAQGNEQLLPSGFPTA